MHTKPKPRVVAIFGQMRSGSTLLCSVLAEHPEVTCDAEIFNHSDPGWWNSTPPPGWDFAQRQSRPLDFIDAVVAQVSTPVYVFKILPGQNDQIWQHWINQRLPLIAHHRDNLIRSFLSLELARHTKKWHHLKGSMTPPKKVTFSGSRFLQFQKNLHYPVANLAVPSASQWPFSSVYEKMNEGSYWKNLFAFLGVQPAPVSSCYGKPPPPPLHQLVENFGEMEDFLTTNGFADELHKPDLQEI